MEMWPVSSNIAIAPPEITTLPGRPAKSEKKKVGETKKSGKLPRTGLAMTCSVYHVRGHNKKGCPHRAPSCTNSSNSYWFRQGKRQTKENSNRSS
ncbi:hypothetical protein P3S68_016470 [Capsicum galapagoense]